MSDDRGQMSKAECVLQHLASNLCHLESGAAPEPEYLRVVVGFLPQRVGEVEPQWAERRIPDQAYTDRGADAAVAARRQCFTGRARAGKPRCRPNVIQQLTRVGKHRKLHAEILRCKEHRRLEFHRGGPVERAAERVGLAEAKRYLREVSRSETGRRKSADHVRPALEVVEHAQTFAAPAGGIAALGADQTYDVGKDLIVESGVDGRLEKSHITAGAGAVLLEFDKQAVGWVSVVVQCVVRERIAERRYDDRSRRQLLAHRQRSLAVRE